MGTAIKHPVPNRVSPERQNARVSKITNDGLTRSGTGCSIATYGNIGRQRVKRGDVCRDRFLRKSLWERRVRVPKAQRSMCGVWGGGSASSPEIFRFLDLKWANFGSRWKRSLDVCVYLCTRQAIQHKVGKFDSRVQLCCELSDDYNKITVLRTATYKAIMLCYVVDDPINETTS